MSSEEFFVDRTILICARRSTVFRYFTDAQRFADWWGQGSSIEGRAGGAVRIRYPNGVTVSGEVVEIVPEERVVFTYGYDDPQKPIPQGGSRVTVTLAERPEGTLLALRHEVKDRATRDAHVPGWKYQLALFANVAAREEHAHLDEVVDRYFAAWGEADAGRRANELSAVTTDDVTFKDAFGCASGRDDLLAHIAAVRTHMPGVIAREGAPRQCQGTAIVEWTASAPDGQARGRGTNVLGLRPDGRIASVVGFWNS